MIRHGMIIGKGIPGMIRYPLSFPAIRHAQGHPRMMKMIAKDELHEW
jgi:hypothetical protein